MRKEVAAFRCNYGMQAPLRQGSDVLLGESTAIRCKNPNRQELGLEACESWPA